MAGRRCGKSGISWRVGERDDGVQPRTGRLGRGEGGAEGGAGGGTGQHRSETATGAALSAPSTVRRRYRELETVSVTSFMRVSWFFIVATPPSDGMWAGMARRSVPDNRPPVR